MHILVVGGGGREHAIAWKLSQGSSVHKISVAPGNPGIGAESKVELVPIAANDITALRQFASQNAVDMTIVGPEVPLVAGIVDEFEAANLSILGPDRACAQLEGSKAFAKDFMQRHRIPTSSYATFISSDAAHAHIEKTGVPIVIKADGLAAGKGVVVATNAEDAHAAVDAMLGDQVFGQAGARVVIEEFLAGEEASFIALVDGTHCLPFASSQDHKARDDGDLGPNTGGMGAYSPAPVVTADVEAHVMHDIVQPTVKGLLADGMPFKGFLYVGLMIDDTGSARVVEYNVRLGDPETQPLMMRLDSDLAELCRSAIDGTLNTTPAQWSAQPAVGIVLAAGNYPESGSNGEVISGISVASEQGCKVFHAGTAIINDQLVTAGGRVLCVTAMGDDIAEAKAIADNGATRISWPNVRYRKDIGYRAVARLDA